MDDKLKLLIILCKMDRMREKLDHRDAAPIYSLIHENARLIEYIEDKATSEGVYVL